MIKNNKKTIEIQVSIKYKYYIAPSIGIIKANAINSMQIKVISHI